jgi:hypothetical protein
MILQLRTHSLHWTISKLQLSAATLHCPYEIWPPVSLLVIPSDPGCCISPENTDRYNLSGKHWTRTSWSWVFLYRVRCKLSSAEYSEYSENIDPSRYNQIFGEEIFRGRWRSFCALFCGFQYGINRLESVAETSCVSCEVQSEFSAHRVYLCVPYGSHNKRRLFL